MAHPTRIVNALFHLIAYVYTANKARQMQVIESESALNLD